jgi:hypothetical protein
MHKKTYLLPIAIFVIILVLASLACSLPFSGDDKGDEESTASSVEVDAGNDGDSDNDNDMEDSDPDVDHENGDSDAAEEMEPATDDGNDGSDAPFPLTDDADILVESPENYVYGTKLSIDETVEFYRSEFKNLGFSERDLLTSIVDDSFSMVFDGHPSGQAILVQGTDFGDSISVSIQFQDI